MKTSEEGSPKFCIFGAGAIGGMIATLLALSGQRSVWSREADISRP